MTISDIGCALRNGFDAWFKPYQSTRLSRYNAGPLSLGQTCSDVSSLAFSAAQRWRAVRGGCAEAGDYGLGIPCLRNRPMRLRPPLPTAFRR